MAKPVADVNSENHGGFSTEDNVGITGFSHMHDSGTGGVSIDDDCKRVHADIFSLLPWATFLSGHKWAV